jgi:hypothetical protein
MMVAEEYWEIYDDQSYEDFGELSYTNLSGVFVRIPTEPAIEQQVQEIRRLNGTDVEIKVYKR